MKLNDPGSSLPTCPSQFSLKENLPDQTYNHNPKHHSHQNHKRENQQAMIPYETCPTPTPIFSLEKPPSSAWVRSQIRSPSPDEGHLLFRWHDLVTIIKTNNLSVLRRTPTQDLLYAQWTSDTISRYGSVMNFLLTHRLPPLWTSTTSTTTTTKSNVLTKSNKSNPKTSSSFSFQPPQSATPFSNPSDYTILLNHWPYALDPEILHVVVWTRTPLPVDAERGDLTPEGRKIVEGFVRRCFVERLGEGAEDRVLWFKNWSGLQSVKALHHVHVLMRGVDVGVLGGWGVDLTR